MNKREVNRNIKVAAVSVLSVGLFSAAFIGANRLAFEAVNDKTENLPPVTMADGLPVAETSPVETEADGAPEEELLPQDGYKQPEFDIFETPTESEKSAAALSPEEAAGIGAKYIWDMYGESIDGMTVEMQYNGYSGRTRPYWIGQVGSDRAEMEKPIQRGSTYSFYFIIDAVSGARVEISQNENRLGDVISSTTREGWEEIKREIPDDLDEYSQIAMDYAKKHFDATTAESVVFDHTDVILSRGDDYVIVNDAKARTPAEKEEIEALFNSKNEEKQAMIEIRGRGEYEAPPVEFREKALHFKAVDDTGREARIIISYDTKQLVSLTTFHNDLLPGVSEGY